MKTSNVLRAAGIDKCCGYTARSLFVIIFNMTFKGKSLTRFLSSERGEDLPKIDAYYRF